MSKVSIIIPSRNEKHLAKTVEDIFAKAAGEIEVIAVLDGPTEYAIPAPKPNLKLITKPHPEGMRAALNSAVAQATGKYLMKCDAHCMFAPEFDETLKTDCNHDWVVTARRYALDPDRWTIIPDSGIDYFYLSCPWTDNNFWMRIMPWRSRAQKRADIKIDDTMSFHGSMWFMTSRYFQKRLQGLSAEGYGQFAGEPHEIGMKTWLGGGGVIINKKTWYAQMDKLKQDRGWPLSLNDLFLGLRYASRYWTKNQWPDRIHDFDWLIDKFWPLPTANTLIPGEKYSWPENWRDYYTGKLQGRKG